MFYLRTKFVNHDGKTYRLTSFRIFGFEVYSSQCELSPITLRNCEPKKDELFVSNPV
jgi:hypothetical protein